MNGNGWARFESESHHLSGIQEQAGSYWGAKWEQAKGRLYAILGEFLGLRKRIQDKRQRLTAALARAESIGEEDRALQIREAIREGDALMSKQAALESDVQGAVKQVQDVESGTLGFAPVLVIVPVIGAVALVVGAVVIHTQMTNKWHRKADLLEQGLIAPGQLDQGFSFNLIPWWVWVVAMGGGAWWLLRRR